MFLRPNNEKIASDFIMRVCVYLKYIHLQNKSKTNNFLYQICRLFILLKGILQYERQIEFIISIILIKGLEQVSRGNFHSCNNAYDCTKL